MTRLLDIIFCSGGRVARSFADECSRHGCRYSK
jgi:hypothetical protein